LLGGFVEKDSLVCLGGGFLAPLGWAKYFLYAEFDVRTPFPIDFFSLKKKKKKE
jgi:hypothetical protein